MTLPAGTKFTILAPYVRGKKGEYRKQMLQMVKEGFTRAVVDGEMVELADPPMLDKQKKHTIDIVIDRLVGQGRDRAAPGRFAGDRHARHEGPGEDPR